MALIALAGCAHQTQTQTQTPTPTQTANHPIDPWVLTCYDPKAEEPALLWNGRIGIRLGRDGRAISPRGNRLGLLAINAYEKTGEERIESFANPLDDAPQLQGIVPQLAGSSEYSQTLNMRTGELVSAWTQPIPDGRQIRIAHTVILDPNTRTVADRWQFTGQGIHKDQDPPAAVPASPIENSPPQVRHTRVEEVSPTPNGPSTVNFDTVVAIDSVGEQVPPPNGMLTYDQVLNNSKRIWAERWQTDILIDGPPEDQQAIHSWLFYLRSAITTDPKAPVCISPFGLSSNLYNGHVFWDADIWVFPALALIDPDEAKTIPNYRLAKLDQAKQNYQDWINKGKPADKYKVPGGASPGGIKYPWESGVSGKETMPGPSRFEDHVTGSVAFGLAQAASLGLIPEDAANQPIHEAGEFYEARSEPGPNGREIKRTLSPDENQVANNDLYTNLLAEWALNGGIWHREIWRPHNRIPDSGSQIDTSWYQPANYKLPHDNQTFLTYDNDPLMSYQQAAAVLAIYPLQYPPAEKQAKQMMDRFAGKISPYGPAMSDSLHAVIWARLGDTDKAYGAWHKGWQPFMTGPLGLFSEKRAVEETYFVTGAAGSLQSVLYGFLGIRIDSANRSDDAWSKKILGDRVLSVSPHLPKTWNSVKFKNFSLLGRHYTLVETRTPHGVTTHVTQGD